jgi:hypothetical protein
MPVPIQIRRRNTPEKPHLWPKSGLPSSPAGPPPAPPEKPHLSPIPGKSPIISGTYRKHVAYHFNKTTPENAHLCHRVQWHVAQSDPPANLPKSLTVANSTVRDSISPIKRGGAFPVSNRKLSPEFPHLKRFSAAKPVPKTLTFAANDAISD